MQNISIRAVDTRDPDVVATLLQLQKKCLPYDTPYDVSRGHWWIAYDGYEAVGFAGIVRSISWYDCGYLCRAGVVASHRGKGLQKKLIRVREAKARKLGWRWLITDTRDNPASSNSLINCGFKLYNPTVPWGFKDALYWRKKLNAVQRSGKKKSKA